MTVTTVTKRYFPHAVTRSCNRYRRYHPLKGGNVGNADLAKNRSVAWAFRLAAVMPSHDVHLTIDDGAHAPARQCGMVPIVGLLSGGETGGVSLLFSLPKKSGGNAHG
mgnify:CR=1 FL=1